MNEEETVAPKKNSRQTAAQVAAAKKKRELQESARAQEEKLKRIAAKESNTSAPAARDFFGRVVKRRPGTGGDGEKKNSKFAKHPIFYRFNEGFTNAVRRKVYVDDFL